MMLRFFILFLLSLSCAYSQLLADFETTEGNFTVNLDYIGSPLACANFVMLAGKKDDIWETPTGAASITSSRYRSTAESDAPRLELRVEYVPAPAGGSPLESRYNIFHQLTYLGSVTGYEIGGAYRDVTGAGRFELRQLTSNPNRFQLKFIYPRPWLDPRTQSVKEAPMYKNIPITRVERGKRFFSGSFTANAFDHPGYHFQDENILTPGNKINPYGIPFNSPWVLAMDSTGPNTNGSRFFITTTPEPEWNGKYTAFGTVLQNIGRQVVLNIADEETDSSGAPLRQMKILSISIRHLNGAATFFESYHQDKLPGLITPLPLSIDRSNGAFDLVTALRPQTQNVIFQSSDLKTFQPGALSSQSPFLTEAVGADLTPSSQFFSRRFYKGFSVAMPNWPSADIDFKGGRFVFKLFSENGEGTLSLNFSESGEAAAYTVDTVVEQFVLDGDPITHVTQGSGILSASYRSDTGPYTGTLTFSGITGPLDVDEITLNFESAPNILEGDSRSFYARKLGTGPFFYGYTGIYQRLN